MAKDMNGSEGLRFTPPRKRQALTNDSYEGLRFTTPRQRAPQGDSWGPLIGKSALQGLASIPDLPANLLHLAERGGRKTLGFLREQAGKPNNIDMGSENDYFSPENVDRPSKWLNAGADKLGIDITPRPTTAGQRIASNAAEFAGGVGPFGWASKGAKALSAINTAGKGALIGGASGALQEGGVNPLVADLASIVAAPTMAAKLNPKNLYSGFKKLPETAAKIPLKIMGLSPKGLNIEAAQAARDLGIDLPAAALTDSSTTALLNQHIGKTPFFGSQLKDKYATADQQILDSLKDIYKDIGPKKTPSIKNEISNKYLQTIEGLPENAAIEPIHTLNEIKKIKIDTALPSVQEKDLAKALEGLDSSLNPKISKKYGVSNSQFGEIKLPANKTDISTLIGTKRSLNAQIKWDTEPGVKSQLKKVLAGVNKDIARYGETNPEWYKTFQEADKLYGDVAKRTKVEKLLSGKGENYSTGQIQHSSLSKTIHNPETAEILKRSVSPEIFSKIEKLGKVSRAFALKNKNAPNPSGTASTANIINLVGGIATGSMGLPYIAGLGAAGAAITSLLTDKRFIDLALRYAEKPNAINVIPFNKRIKEITGYSVISLNKELQRAEQGERNK